MYFVPFSFNFFNLISILDTIDDQQSNYARFNTALIKYGKKLINVKQLEKGKSEKETCFCKEFHNERERRKIVTGRVFFQN